MSDSEKKRREVEGRYGSTGGVHEVEHVEVEGLDVSGHWNRMYDERVITSYHPEEIESVTELEGGETLGRCYQCAQCVSVCPVDQAGGDYGPRKVYRRTELGIDLSESPDLWMCTTCQNCVRVCPKEVDMIDIMPAVREEKVMEGDMPAELQDMFENVFKYGNPQGESPKKRAKWTRNADVEVPILPRMSDPEPVEYLWYVGDFWSYYPRGQDAATAMASVLDALDIDYGILGSEEKCDGDSQRLAGEVGLFEMMAEDNAEAMAQYDFDKIVVSGPHALNAMQNEYEKVLDDWDEEVVHYSQLLADRMDELEWETELDYTVTFHDPCYLGRHNDEYESPRKMIRSIPGVELVEMPRNREDGYCCGGGGGGMWLDGFVDDYQEERLSDNRAREASNTEADALVVTCPYEVSRFEDSMKNLGVDMEVKDIIELVEEAMAPPA